MISAKYAKSILFLILFRSPSTTDQAIFPEGDHHCACNIEKVEIILRKTYEQLRQHFIVPVKSKICEYLYRYGPEIYQILSNNNYAQFIYEISMLGSQWDHIRSNSDLNQK